MQKYNYLVIIIKLSSDFFQIAVLLFIEEKFIENYNKNSYYKNVIAVSKGIGMAVNKTLHSANSKKETRGKGRPRAFDRVSALHSALEVFWQQGYEPASVADLCKAMHINPPSLYAAFGNKASLFLEALRHYEHTYWDAPAARFMKEPDIYTAVEDFFSEAAKILLSPETPCGCMVVLAAVNISETEKEIIETVRKFRLASKKMFADRLRQAISDGQIPADTDVPALAGALNTLLEGLSIQARDGLFQSELKAFASYAVRMLPPRIQ